MNSQESQEFIRAYFVELFVKRNIEALDVYLDPNYFDDDIGDPNTNHIQNSKKYLAELFKTSPTIGVNVVNAITHDDVISAYLEWYTCENDIKKIIRKGIAIFVIKDRKILKRHTYIYFGE